MAFKRTQHKKALTLPSFIDIIFLLLVFFIATINMSTVVSDRNQGSYNQVKFDLPETRSRNTGAVYEILRTLLIEIDKENREDPISPLRVMVLWPNARDSLTIIQAREIAKKQGNIAYFLSDSAKLAYPDLPDRSPYQLIEREITKYAEKELRIPGPENYIEIRAVKATDFRVINHILQTCSKFDDRIPRIHIRTMTGDPAAYVL